MIFNFIYLGLIFFLNNKPIDALENPSWEFIFKPNRSFLPNGRGYLYMSDKQSGRKWNFFSEDITSETIPEIMVTTSTRSSTGPQVTVPKSKLNEILQNFILKNEDPNVSFLLYNDKTPNKIPGKTITLGEGTKNFGNGRGVLMWNNEVAVWLVHSVAEYPLPFSEGKYNYPQKINVYGQSFLFLHLKLGSIKTIMMHLMIMRARVYDMKLNEFGERSLKEAHAELYNENDGSSNESKKRRKNREKIERNFVTTLTTIDGAHFKIITKSSKETEELWIKVSKNFQNSKIQTKSFFRSPDHLRRARWSRCKGNLVDILKIRITSDRINGLQSGLSLNGYMNYYFDRSKFGICKNQVDSEGSEISGPNCYCLSSLNRKRRTNGIQKDAGIAVCLFDMEGEKSARKLNKAWEKSVAELSC